MKLAITLLLIALSFGATAWETKLDPTTGGTLVNVCVKVMKMDKTGRIDFVQICGWWDTATGQLVTPRK